MEAKLTYTSSASPSPIKPLISRRTCLLFRAVMGMSKLLGFDDLPVPVPLLRAKEMLKSKF